MAKDNGRSKFESGTRFRLFPQPPFLEPFREPETIWVSSPAGSVGPGPADARMYVIDPIGKAMSYGEAQDRSGNSTFLLPPWPGPIHPPAIPDSDGHFDHIAVESPEFEAAHFYAAARWTLDIWEKYFGHRIEWHFKHQFDRLELVLQRNLQENAFMGFGFLEVGFHRAEDDEIEPFSLNFDVIAHEIGHCIIYAMVGVPNPGKANAEYYGFHESAADLTALIAALHFNTVVDDLLNTTHGNLYTLNLVNRIAELSQNQQIRLAANSLSLNDFIGGWRDEHDLAQPLTGALFDIFVDIFHEELVARQLISARSEDLSDRLENDPDYHEIVQPIFDEAFAAAPDGFRTALIDARDTVGLYLAETWRRMSPDHLGYDDIGRTLLSVDQMLSGGRFQQIIGINLDGRAIGTARVGPRLALPGPDSHFDLPRVFVPPTQQSFRRKRFSYRARYDLFND